MAIDRNNLTAEQKAQIAAYGYVVSDAGKTSPAMTLKNPPIANPSNPTGAAPIERPALSGFGGVQNDPAYQPTGLVGTAAPAPSAATSGFVTGGGPTPGRTPAPAPSAPNMQADWNSYWSTSKAGDTQSFAGGTLKRNADGSATYVDGSGKAYTYNSGTSFGDVAKSNAGIAELWKNTYGFSVPSQTGSNGSSGLIGSPSTGTQPGGSNVVGGGFQPWDVTAPQTVQQQAEDIIAQDSGLMQQARGRAMQQMNERGLINSSIGIQAGQDAVMDRALQIAGQDAATYAENAKFNAGQGNAWNLSQQELALKDSQFKSEMEYKRWAVMQDFENSKVLKQLDSELGDLKTSDAAFDSQYQMYIDLLYRIDSNPDLDAAAKTTMKNEATANLRNYAKIRGLNLDLSNLPTFEVPGSATAPTSGSASTAGGRG